MGTTRREADGTEFSVGRLLPAQPGGPSGGLNPVPSVIHGNSRPTGELVYSVARIPRMFQLMVSEPVMALKLDQLPLVGVRIRSPLGL